MFNVPKKKIRITTPRILLRTLKSLCAAKIFRDFLLWKQNTIYNVQIPYPLSKTVEIIWQRIR